jgi:limonene-1,2-epoxide hydrolase
MQNATIIENFITAWSRLNPSELADFFTEDGVYHNMPAAPVSGRANIEKFIAAFLADWTSTDWELLTLISDGETVVAERLDRTKVGNKPVDLPCVGIFQMQDGKIRVWRDYFDMGTYMNALK